MGLLSEGRLCQILCPPLGEWKPGVSSGVSWLFVLLRPRARCCAYVILGTRLNTEDFRCPVFWCAVLRNRLPGF